MKPLYKLFSILSLLAFVLSACSSTAPAQPDTMEKNAGSDALLDKEQEQAMSEEGMTNPKPTGNDMQKDTDQDQMMAGPTPDATAENEGALVDNDMSEASEMVALPGFFTISLTDAATNQAFTIQDFKGKVVLVETLAMWCSNCLKQQRQVKALHELLGERDDFVSIGLDIDPNEYLGDLQAYVASNGFDWLYAIAPSEVTREIGQLYGPNFLNPPSTPILIIDRQGEVHPLPFGIKSAQELYDALQPFLNEGM